MCILRGMTFVLADSAHSSRRAAMSSTSHVAMARKAMPERVPQRHTSRYCRPISTSWRCQIVNKVHETTWNELWRIYDYVFDLSIRNWDYTIWTARAAGRNATQPYKSDANRLTYNMLLRWNNDTYSSHAFACHFSSLRRMQHKTLFSSKISQETQLYGLLLRTWMLNHLEHGLPTCMTW